MHEPKPRSFQVPENSVRNDSLVPTKLPSCKVPNNAASAPASFLPISQIPYSLWHYYTFLVYAGNSQALLLMIVTADLNTE